MVNEEDFLMGKTTCGTKKKWVSVLKKGVVESGEFFFWMWKATCGLKKGECLGRTESVWEKKGKGSESVCKKGRRELKGELNGFRRFLMGKTTRGTKKKVGEWCWEEDFFNGEGNLGTFLKKVSVGDNRKCVRKEGDDCKWWRELGD